MQPARRPASWNSWASCFSLSPYHLLAIASRGMYTSGTPACVAITLPHVPASSQRGVRRSVRVPERRGVAGVQRGVRAWRLRRTTRADGVQGAGKLGCKHVSMCTQPWSRLALVVLPVPGGPSNSTALGQLLANVRRVLRAMLSKTCTAQALFGTSGGILDDDGALACRGTHLWMLQRQEQRIFNHGLLLVIACRRVKM